MPSVGPDQGNGPTPAVGRGAIHFAMIYTGGAISTACEQAFPDRALKIVNQMAMRNSNSPMEGVLVCPACYAAVNQHWIFVPE